MTSVIQQSEPYAEFRAIGVCTRAATVKLVRSIRVSGGATKPCEQRRTRTA